MSNLKNQIASGNHEKAWNDPPQLSFSSTTNQSKSNRLQMMKKGVHVPITVTDMPKDSTNSCLNENILPISKMSMPIESVQELKENVKIPADSQEMDSETLLNQVQNGLGKVLDNLSDDSLEHLSKEDILKRINTLKNMWLDNKLNCEVKQQMNTLATALAAGDYSEAWSTHQTLIVDYTTSCSSWMLGVKALILAARKEHSIAESSSNVATSNNECVDRRAAESQN